MSAPVDRELVLRLLQDDSLSFREIGRRANCSEWSVRSIARSLETETAPDEEVAEPTSRDWLVLAGVVAAVFFGFWILGRGFPPRDGAI